MDNQILSAALEDIAFDEEAVSRRLKMVSLCGELYRQHGVELIAVGDTAIELLTRCLTTSGVLDFCLLNAPTPPSRLRQEIMGRLGGRGGPRSWQIGDMFFELLGPWSPLARTAPRQELGPYGLVALAPPEELLVERVLVSTCPEAHAPARETAKLLVGTVLRGDLTLDWEEVQRLTRLPDYEVFDECRALVAETAAELNVANPLAG